MYLLTAFGITVGFHRLFVHRSFYEYTPVNVVFATLGSMAVQGDRTTWVGIHRRHHQFIDTPDDPHTPHHHGPGLLGWLKGYWHAHIGWFFEPTSAGLDQYVRDLLQSKRSAS